jgi:predicted phosphodiesterase
MIEPHPLDAVLERAHLKGRDELFAEIYDGVLGRTCFVVYGGDRLGKTSLLRSLQRQLKAAQGAPALVAYVSLLGLRGRGEIGTDGVDDWQQRFWGHLRSQASQQTSTSVSASPCEFEEFERWLESVLEIRWKERNHACPFVFLLDDCDRLVYSTKGNERLDFVCDQLRHLRQNDRIGEQITFVLAGQRRFQRADHQGGSALKNICTPKLLQLLDRTSFAELLSELGATTLPPNVREAIEGHPFLAHFMAKRLQSVRLEELELAWTKAQREAVSTFEALRAQLSEEEKRTLMNVAAAGSVGESDIDPDTRDVLLYMGLLRVEQQGGAHHLTAPVQLLNRHLAPAKKTPVHLTKSTSSKPTQTVSWLHVSDFHFKEHMEPDRRRVLNEMLDDVKALRREWTPDFILVTGDLTYSGRPVEFDMAWRHLNSLATAAEVNVERIFVVPGNHDVDRGLHRPTIFSGLRSAADSEAYSTAYDQLIDGGLQQEAIVARLRNFYQFSNEHFPSRRLGGDKFWFMEQLNIRGTKLSLVGLNSAWASGENEEDLRRHLCVGLRQAEAAIDALRNTAERPDLRFFLIHHPLENLLPRDSAILENLLMKNCDILFRGHLHEARVIVQGEPGGGRYATLAAGSAYEKAWCLNGYSFGRAIFKPNGKSNGVRIEGLLRKWLPGSFRFSTDTDTYRGATRERSFQIGVAAPE